MPTCAKEKHADVVDGLSCRQLESGFGFVDLLQIRLQESSGYAATKHRSVGIGSVDKVICSVCSCSTDFLRPSRVVVGGLSRPGPFATFVRSSCVPGQSHLDLATLQHRTSLDFPNLIDTTSAFMSQIT